MSSRPVATSFSAFAKRVNDVLSCGLFADTSSSLLGSNLGRVLFVVGNESADLDSCASSILGAYCYTVALQLNKAPRLPSSYPSFKPEIVIPLINIHREDLNLRPDITFLLSTVGYSIHSVAFLDDFSAKIDKSSSSTLPSYNSTDAYAVLVDHNKLDGPTRQLFKADRVVGILDHHADEGAYKEANPRIIVKTGSCMSVLATYWRNQFGLGKGESVSFSQEDKSGALSSLLTGSDAVKFSILGLGPIVSDTSGLTNKVDNEDKEAFAFYSKIIEENSEYIPSNEDKGIENNKPSSSDSSATFVSTTTVVSSDTLGSSGLPDTFTHPGKFSKLLDSKKRDISSMSPSQLLRKDYKEWDRDEDSPSQKDLKIGISSIPASLREIYSKYSSESNGRTEFAKDAKNWGKKRGLDLFVAMTTYHNSKGAFCRDLFLVATSPKLADSEVRSLIKNLTEPLDLKDPEDKDHILYDEESDTYQFLQGESKSSRKQVAPLVRHLVQGIPWTKI